MSQFQVKDLSKEPPRSPSIRIGGVAIIARTIDKCRADIASTVGEYCYNCPLDKYLFNFMSINSDEFKAYVAQGHSDEEIAQWVKDHGVHKTDEEIAQWSDTQDRYSYHVNSDQEMKEWFDGECIRLGLDPEKTSLFRYLEVDDATHFPA